MKKLLCFILILITLISPVTYANVYNDLDSAPWAETSIQNMYINGFLDSFKGGLFEPNKVITRAELVAVINKMNGFTEASTINFKDVPDTHWANKDIKIAVQAGYVSGFGDGSFGPDQPLKREQLAAIINTLYYVESKTISKPIKDFRFISTWAVQAVANIVSNEIMVGFPSGNFEGKVLLTRAQAVTTLNKLILSDRPTREKWLASQNNLPTEGSGGPAIEVPVVSTPEIISKLNLVVSRMNSRVVPTLTTELQRETAQIIIASITRYIGDDAYDTSADVTKAKGNVALMNNIEYQAFKNAITSKISIGDLSALNDVFQLIDISK